MFLALRAKEINTRGAFASVMEQPISARFDSYFARSRFLLSFHPLPSPPPSPYFLSSNRQNEIWGRDHNTVQEFFTRCYNRNYISHHGNVSELVEKTDLAIANRTSQQPSHPLLTFCLVLKKALLTVEILEVCCRS